MLSLNQMVPKFFLSTQHQDEAGMNLILKVSNTRFRLPTLVDTSVDQFSIGSQSHLR